MQIFIDSNQQEKYSINKVIPADLQERIIPWCETSFETFGKGNMLCQEFLCRYYKICQYRIAIDKPTSLYAYCDHPCISLQFTSSSVMQQRPGDTGLHFFDPESYGLVYLPEGTHEIRLLTGTHESLHIEIFSCMAGRTFRNRRRYKHFKPMRKKNA